MTARLIGRRIVRLGVVASTMDEVGRLGRAGEPEGTVVVAREQSAGRGRAGRGWQAPAGTSLLCSVLLRPRVGPERLGRLSLVAGVAVAEAIEELAGSNVRLKWPNDVWLGDGPTGRKVAGLLAIAQAGEFPTVVLGVGVNVNSSAEQLPVGGTSLLAETGRVFEVDLLLSRFLERLEARYVGFLADGGASGVQAWRRRAALVGDAVEVVEGGVTRRGVMRGVDEDGALVLERADGGRERVVAGDLTRGPFRAGG